jgi:hypothetical protein
MYERNKMHEFTSSDHPPQWWRTGTIFQCMFFKFNRDTISLMTLRSFTMSSLTSPGIGRSAITMRCANYESTVSSSIFVFSSMINPQTQLLLLSTVCYVHSLIVPYLSTKICISTILDKIFRHFRPFSIAGPDIANCRVAGSCLLNGPLWDCVIQ